MSRNNNDSFWDVASKAIHSLEIREKFIENHTKPKFQTMIILVSMISFFVMNLTSHGLASVKLGYEIVGESATGFNHHTSFDFSSIISIIVLPMNRKIIFFLELKMVSLSLGRWDWVDHLL